MRLIDADEMLKRFEEWNTDDGMDRALYNFALHRIIEQPTVTPEPQWILCSERLPKQGQEVICQCRANIIKVLKLDADGDWYQDADHCYMSGFVIAWMPLPALPKPYREERR